MESSDSNSVVHMTNLVIDAPGITSVDCQTVREEERRDTSLDSECCRVKGFFETCQEADVSTSVDRQFSDLQVAEVDTTSHHVKYKPEVEDITNDSVDLYGDLEKMATEHFVAEKEVTLPQDAVSHELFNDNAMDLSLVEDTSPPGTHMYPSSFGMNLKPDSDTGSKLSSSCKRSNPVDENINRSSGNNFLSPVTPTTSKAHSLCSSSSPHSTHSTRRIVPTSSPLKSPGWRDYLRSPVRSPKVRKLMRQKMKKASKDDMNSSKREQSLSDSEVEDMSESSRLSALDLYTDVLEDSVQVKYQGEIRKLQEQITQHSNKLEEMNITTNDLREKLKLTEAESEKVKAENMVLRMNISRLMKTAQQEMKSKHREILNLELRLKNGGNEELLRRVIPYQPYTGKGLPSCKDDSVQTGSLQNKSWSSSYTDGNLTKRRQSVRETALTVMKEVKDAVSGREENAAVEWLSSTACGVLIESPVEAASGDIIQSPVEAAINDIKQSYDSSSRYIKTASVERLEEKRKDESEKEDWQRSRCSQSSSCEKFCKEREPVSHEEDRKSHDCHSNSAKDESHEQERQHEIVGRRRRRYSRSSSCEKLSRERERTSQGKDSESHDYPSKSVREEKRDKQEGHYEHENSNRRKRILRSSSHEKLSRERESVSHGKNRKSHDYSTNLAREEKRHKIEKEGNFEHEQRDKRRRILRSSSCEKSSRERESSHGKDRKSYDFLSKSAREEKGHEKDRNDRLERSNRSRRISRSSSCENLSKERELLSVDCDRESHDYPSKSARGDRRDEHENSGLRRRRYSRSSSREREAASHGKDRKSEIENSYELEKEGSLKTGKIERRRRYSRSSSCEKSSRERKAASHGKDKSKMEKRYELEKERSLKMGKIERRRHSRSSSCEKSSREREPSSNEKDIKSSKEEKSGESKKEENHEQAKRDRKRRYPQSSSCEKSLMERDFAAHEKGINFSREEKRGDSEKKRNYMRAESNRKRRYSRSSSCEKCSKERDRASPEKDIKSASDEKRGECKKEEKHERARGERKRRHSRSRSCEKLPRETESKFYSKERGVDDYGSKSAKKDKDEDGKAKTDDYKRRERQRGRRNSRSRSHDKASVERNSKSDDEPHISDNNNSKSLHKERNEKREWTRERKNSTSSSCERSSRISGSHERDSDDHLTARRSHDHSSQSKKYDGDQLLKRSLKAERRSRSGSHERRKIVHSKDSVSSDSHTEFRRRKAKESEKTEVSKQRKNSTLDSGKHTCGEKDVRLNDEKESDDEDDDVGSRGSKKYDKEDYEEKESSSKVRRWSPDEIFESSKAKEVSNLGELGKKDEQMDKNYHEKQRGKNNLKRVSSELSSKRQKVALPDGDSGDIVTESSDYHLQASLRHRKTIKSSKMEKRSDRMREELRSSSNERLPERSPRKRETHSSQKELETRISSSKVETLEVFSEVRDKGGSRIHGERLDRKSNEKEESEEMEKDLLELADAGGENKNKSIQKSDTDKSDEEDFEVESEEFELIKSVGIEMSDNIKTVDNAGKARRNVERLEPHEIEAELEGNENLEGKSEEEKDKDGMLRSCLKEPLKRKRDENTFDSKSDCLAKSSHDTTEIRRTRRKCEQYEHGTKDLEWKDSMSEQIVKKKTDVCESHSGSRLGKKLDYDDKGGLKKKTKESKLRSRGHSMREEMCKRVEENRSLVSRFTGDSMNSHEEEIRSHDVENESHDQSSRSTEVSVERDGETKKVAKKKKKLCKPKVKSCKARNTPAEGVKGLLEKKEQSDNMPSESVPDIDKESKIFKENEISSQSYLEGRKDSSHEVTGTEEKERNVETLRDKGTEKGTVGKLQSRSEEKKSNSGSSSDDCFSTKIAVSDHINPSSQQETMLRGKERPLLSNNNNTSTYNSHLLSDLQMSSDTGDDDSKVQMFDELSLTCDGQIFLSSDGEHQEFRNKDGQQELLSFTDHFQNDHKIDSCEEKVSEGEGINAQQENLSISSMQEADILGEKDDIKPGHCSISQNSDQEAPENEMVRVEDLSLKDRTSNEPTSGNNLENKFKYKRQTEGGIVCLVSPNEGEMSNTSTGERTSTEVTSQSSHETTSGEDGETLQENGDGVNENSLEKESHQQTDEVSTTSAFQMNKKEDALFDVSDSSKKIDSVLNDSSPGQGEVSCQNRNDFSVIEHTQTESMLYTPAKGPFTFEQGHTLISCGKPFTKIVGSIPAEETVREEVEFKTIQEEDAINVYVSDSSLTDPFSPDKCKKDLFKDKTVKKERFSPEKVRRKLSSVVVSSRSETSAKSRSSTSKMKLKDQDVLRKRIVSRYAGRERSVSQMRPMSSKRELARKYLQRAKHVQRSKPHESLIKVSPKRGRHSDDLRDLILKRDRMKSESRHTDSPSYTFDPLRDPPLNRWQRRRMETVRQESAVKGYLKDRKRDERSVPKQRSHRNSGKIIEDGNGDWNNKSLSTRRREKLSDYKEEKKLELVTEKEKTVKPVKETDTSLSDGEIRSDSDENIEDERITKNVQLRTERTISIDRDEKRTRKSSRHSSSRRTSRRR